MAARDRAEAHRTSTPLELLFDLCFVVAIAQAGVQLHHGLVSGHVLQAVGSYGLVFFAIWWAWMNFTWFASAYDSDDVPYRLGVFAQMAGALTLAAGVPRAFEHQAFGVSTIGYLIMRLSLITLWLRAARCEQGQRRRTAYRYALGVGTVQLGWLALATVPPELWLYGWFVLAPAELLVPIWAERTSNTTWHPQHIAERYGLFTLIVLGESVLAATFAIQHALDAARFSVGLLGVIVGSLSILFSMWWVYFDRPLHDLLTENRFTFRWGYGHVVIFATTAALGAGLAAAAELADGSVQAPAYVAGAAVGGPVALYLIGVWLLCVRPLGTRGRVGAAFPVAALLCVGAAFAPHAVLVIGLIMVALVALMVLSKLRPASAPAGM